MRIKRPKLVLDPMLLAALYAFVIPLGLGVLVLWDKLRTLSDAPAWVQAVGSIIAIGAGFVGIIYQTRLTQESLRAAEDERIAKIKGLVLKMIELAQRIESAARGCHDRSPQIRQAAYKNLQFWRVHLTRLFEAADKVELLSLPDVLSLDCWTVFREDSRELLIRVGLYEQAVIGSQGRRPPDPRDVTHWTTRVDNAGAEFIVQTKLGQLSEELYKHLSGDPWEGSTIQDILFGHSGVPIHGEAPLDPHLTVEQASAFMPGFTLELDILGLRPGTTEQVLVEIWGSIEITVIVMPDGKLIARVSSNGRTVELGGGSWTGDHKFNLLVDGTGPPSISIYIDDEQVAKADLHASDVAGAMSGFVIARDRQGNRPCLSGMIEGMRIFEVLPKSAT